MNLDPQIVRAEILTGCPRPAPEPDEREVREIAQHLGTTIVSKENPAQNTTTEAAR
jgi:hypothetical protein